MIRRRINISLALCFVFVWSLAGCAGMQALMDRAFATPQKKYLVARTEYNKQLSKYSQLFQKQDEATRAVWREKYSSKFVAIDKVLDAWSIALNGGLPTADNEKDWISMKDDLIDMIANLSKKGGQ